MNSSKIQTIVCLGDSITTDWDQKSYPIFWEELLKEKNYSTKVIVAGINGETAQDGYYRTHRDVISQNPDLVTIMFGHNDADPNRNMSPVLFANYLRKIVNYIQHETHADIWLLTPNQLGDDTFNERYQPYLEMIKKAADDKKVHFVDLFSVFKEENVDDIFIRI